MANNLFQYRKAVRQLLRDDSYPQDDIDAAINRVINDINVSGRYRFHEAQYSFNLVANTYEYAVPGNCLGETVMYYALGNNTYQREIPRKREIFAHSPVIPTSTGNSPDEWARYDNNWIIYPKPDATMVANGNCTVFYDKDLDTMLSPTDTTGVPDRHENVLIYGATSQLRPNLMIATPKGDIAVTVLYKEAFENMQTQEHWDKAYIPTLRQGPRWRNNNQWGFVSRVR